MKNNRPVIVGIFVLLGIAILVVTIFALGGQKKTFVKTFTIHAVFNDVNGLIKGSNVWFSGVKVGTVKSISFSGTTQVEVAMNIEKDIQSHIRKNAMVKIGSDGLIGNKIVVIYGGDSTAPQVEKGDFLTMERATSTDDMMATLQANNKNLLAITSDFKSISKKIDSGTGTLATLVNDPAMAGRLSSAVENLQAAVANFKTVSESSKNVLVNLQGFSGKLNAPGNSINDLVADTVLYKNIRNSLLQLQNATAAVSQFTTNLKTTSEKLNQKDNAVGVLLNDPATGNSVKTTLENMAAASKKLDEDLEALQHNFLLRGFFRKKAKAEAKAAAITPISQQ